ncbi:MAG: hypothetical protein FWD26_02570 [Treponema sp.]|nr:hypothetical protein [Treponema sp.]
MEYEFFLQRDSKKKPQSGFFSYGMEAAAHNYHNDSSAGKAKGVNI